MDERRWERYGASAGIAFVVLLLASVFVSPAPPHPDASADKIATYYADNSGRVLFATVCGLCAIIAFVWFASHLRHVLNRAEGGAEAFAPIVYGSAMVTAAVAGVTGLPQGTLAFLARSGDLGDGGMVRALFGMNLMAGCVVSVAAALFLAATAAAILKGEMVSRWLGWAGGVTAAVMFLAGIGGLYQTTYEAFWVAVGISSILLLAAWTLAVSIQMYRMPEVARTTARTEVFAH